MSLPDAKSLGPGLLTQLMFAKELGVDKFLVVNVNLRDGLIKEMAQGKAWRSSIQSQITQSAVRVGKRYKFNEAHAIHVSKLACSLFDQLSPLHLLPLRFRSILEIAAILHEIGYFVNAKSRHKHSAFLISNSEFFGIGANDLALVSLVARYHRGASPLPRHDSYAKLDRFKRVAVSKLAAILRVAKALDSSHQQRIKTIHCLDTPAHVELTTTDVEEISMEQLEVRQVGQLFTDIFGKEIVFETSDSRS